MTLPPCFLESGLPTQIFLAFMAWGRDSVIKDAMKKKCIKYILKNIWRASENEK